MSNRCYISTKAEFNDFTILSFSGILNFQFIYWLLKSSLYVDSQSFKSFCRVWNFVGEWNNSYALALALSTKSESRQPMVIREFWILFLRSRYLQSFWLTWLPVLLSRKIFNAFLIKIIRFIISICITFDSLISVNKMEAKHYHSFLVLSRISFLFNLKPKQNSKNINTISFLRCFHKLCFYRHVVSRFLFETSKYLSGGGVAALDIRVSACHLLLKYDVRQFDLSYI